MDDIDIKSQWILYFIMDSAGEVSTPKIDDRFPEIDYEAISYRLRKMKDLGLVNKKSRKEGRGDIKATNYYTPNIEKLNQYENEHGDLSTPRYVYSEKVSKLEDELEAWTEYVETHNKEKEKQIQQLKEKVNTIINRLDDD